MKTRTPRYYERMTSILPALALAAFIALPATSASVAQQPAAVIQPDEAPRITIEEFKKLEASGRAIVVDTRNVDAFNRGHIPGSLLLPLEGLLTWPDEYQSRVETLKKATVTIVTYCA